MEVLITERASAGLEDLSERERTAMENAVRKIRESDRIPGYPHTSRVFGVDRVWELRPRAGRSRTRAFYRVIRGVAVIAAVGPEASVDRRGFRKASQGAQRTLDSVEAEA